MHYAELVATLVIWLPLFATVASPQDATTGGVVEDTGSGVEASSPLLVNDAEVLRVRYVRFNPAEKLNGAPSTVLNFGLSNQGADDLTQIVVKVSILKEPTGFGVGEQLAGPYTIVGENDVLHPGQTLDFKMRLRNLSSHCKCVARVKVLSAHSIRSIDPDHARSLHMGRKTHEPN
jgi:hypothetical protein